MATTDEHAYEWKSRRPSRDVAKARETVRLREVEGLTFQQIAERLGYAHRGTAKKAYDKAVAEGDLQLTDAEHRNLLVRRLERLYAIAAKKGEDEQDLAALREAGRMLDKIARLKALDVATHRVPLGRGGETDREEPGGVVVGANRLEQMRREKEQRAADRAAGR